MSGTTGLLGAPNIAAGEGGAVGPGQGTPPAPPAGPNANSSGTWMDRITPVLLNSAYAGAPAGVVFPGIFIAGSSPPGDTRYGWLDTSSSPAVPKFYNGAWTAIGTQGATGPAGAAGSGTWCFLNSDFTAGAIGAGNLYCNPATPNSFPTASTVQGSDNALNTAYFQVTQMSATQVADPTSGPTIGAASGSGTFTAGAWYVGVALRNAVGSTLVFQIGSVTLTTGQIISAGAITPPAGCTIDYYVSPSVGTTALQFYSNNTGIAISITGPGVGAAEPSVNTTQGLLLTRLAGGSGVGSGFVFAVANDAKLALSGPAGPDGGTGSAGTPRNTTISNGGAGFDAGNFGSTYNIPVATGTGGYDLPGDWVKLWDGTASAYFTANSTSTSSVNATRQNVPGDPTQASPTYNFADGTQVSWIGAPGAPGSAGANSAPQSLLAADFTAGAENATGLTLTPTSTVPFFAGAFVQVTDITLTSAWYQETALPSGGTVTLTRLPIEPPGVTIAPDTYDFTVANGATISLCGPPGQVGQPGVGLTPEIKDLTPQVATGNVTFNLDKTPYSSLILLFWAGVLVYVSDPQKGYSETGLVITMITAPSPGDSLVALIFHT